MFLPDSFNVWSCGNVSSGKSKSHGGGGVSSLRVLRLLRVFRSLKLLRQVEGLNKIVNIVLKVCSLVLTCLLVSGMMRCHYLLNKQPLTL